MIQGFNHNIRYGDRLFHVQTEDSGLANPHIITHLYHGGTIIASKKTSYADILTSDRRDQVIREIMKEQHRKMLLDLRDGRLDASLAAFKLAPAKAGPGAAKAGPGAAKPREAKAGPRSESLDDILLDYLASRTAPGKPRPKKK
jgi:hypothetical protein